MKAVLFAMLAAGAAGSAADPIGQVIAMCQDLSAKVQADGEAQQKAYEEYFEWCDDSSKEKANEIVTLTSQKGKLEASINELTSEAEVCDTKIGDLVSAISQNSKDLDAATKIRGEENDIFVKNEAELEDVVATLGKAMGVLEKELASGSAAFVQVANGATLANLVKTMKVLLDGAAFSISDKQTLTALVQSHQDSEESESDDATSFDELAAPQAANYQKKSGGILDVLGDMKEKAETQLSDLRKAERTSKQNFGKLKQSLTDQLKFDNMDKAAQAKKKAGAEEGKAVAQGELDVTVKALKTTTEGLAQLQKNCMQVAVDHEDAMRATAEELKVIAMAVKIIKEATGALVQTSFLQTSMGSAMSSVQGKVGRILKKLAREHHSSALAQLASRISSLSRNGAFRTTDPFVKIRGMITDMIEKLDKQMGAEAEEKAYCDEEMGKTEEKKKELETTVEKLTNKIDKSAARSAELKDQVATLQEELAILAKETEQMNKVREDEHAVYVQEKGDLTKGLAGIRKALELLRDYYGSASLLQEDDAQPAAPAGHSKSGGAGGSIISILEVAESDMAKELAKIEAEEADEQAAYEETTQNNKVTKVSKDQDVKYKNREAAGLDKLITEVSSDRDSTNMELSAVNNYYAKIQDRCVAKPVSYEERKKAREAEIEGLKTALEVLENEAALVQQGAKGRNMRGSALQL
jgi:hypothetical protein